MNLDDIRARFPQLGFAIFAFAGDPVILEAYGPGGETWQWRGATVADVMGQAFHTAAVAQTPSGAGLPPASRAAREAPDKGVKSGGVSVTAEGVFD